MATKNDLLMDELNVSYFAPKWRLYVMIWLPRTTDNILLSPLKFEVSRADCKWINREHEVQDLVIYSL